MKTHYFVTIVLTAGLVLAIECWWYHGDLKMRWEGWRARAAAKIASWFQ